tara:strand:- start:19405 stop:20370 length:966 start_codon:yes stop_codon:yes gene_type:complete
MAGEYSKRIGDDGEKIVQVLFKNYLGYPKFPGRSSTPCIKLEEHQKLRKNTRKSHGNDGIIYGKSKLDDKILEIGYISVKYSKKPYENTNTQLSSRFKSHFIDLVTAIECFNRSEDLAEIQRKSYGVSDTRIIGLLFWLSGNENSKKESIIEKAAKSILSPIGVPFDEIILVDNDKLQFIFQVVEYASKVARDSYQFVYPHTGYNILGDTNQSFGSKMPLEYFAYPIIPLRYVIENKIIFHLATKSSFSEEGLARLITMAKTFDKLLASKSVILSFPDYNADDHQDIVKKVLTNLDDIEYSNLVQVINLDSDFRNLLDKEI